MSDMDDEDRNPILEIVILELEKKGNQLLMLSAELMEHGWESRAREMLVQSERCFTQAAKFRGGSARDHQAFHLN